MFRVITVVALVVIAAIGPVKALSPSPSPAHSETPRPEPTPTQEENKTAVQDLLKAQQLAWNRGNIDGFMDGYWRSRDTVFVSGSVVTRGWQTVRDRYKSKYPNPDRMGQLSFSEIEVRLFGYDGALAFGRWQLNRSGDNPHGWFTLVLRKMPDGWKIVHDHTSTAE